MFRAEKTMFRLQATSARLLGFLEKIMYAQFAAICRYKDCRAQKNNPDEKTACDDKVTAV